MRWALILIAVLAAGCGGASKAEVARGIRAVTSLDSVPPFAEGIPWETLQAIYQARDYEPLWVSGERPTSRARSLVSAIAKADAEGLRMRDYPLEELREALLRAYEDKDTRASEIADVDLRLTSLYLAYGSDMLIGRLDPDLVDGSWHIGRRSAQADSVLKEAVLEEDFDAMLAKLRPRHAQYGLLLEELNRMRALADSGGWEPLGARPIRPTDSGERVEALRRRLVMAGDLDPDDADGVRFDDALTAAVASFRARHNLPAARGVDADMLRELDVPVEDRIHQIEINLDRMRWLPPAFQDRYVVVNIPDFHLFAFDGGKEVLNMRVVVGEEYQGATPVFADTLSTVVFQPEWNVPRSILVNEIIPKVKDREEWLEANNYEAVDSQGTVVDPDDVDWDADSADFEWRVRQKPGTGNALGAVKFLFPNRFSIYMHDTPTQSTFEADRRAASHGCIRLQYPARFAEYVLGPSGEWDADRIRQAMEGEETKSVSVEPAVPVFILYLTAFERDGKIQFREDVYGKDRKALRKLTAPDSAETLEQVSSTLEQLMQR